MFLYKSSVQFSKNVCELMNVLLTFLNVNSQLNSTHFKV